MDDMNEVDEIMFGPAISKFIITVPNDYNFEGRIDWFREMTKLTNMCCNNALLSKDFSKVTYRLQPGQTYGVKIFPMLPRKVMNEDCVIFLQQQGALFVGAQGLTLVFDLKRDELPKMYIISFDTEEALRDSPGADWIPYMHPDTSLFTLGYCEFGWYGPYCLLCFYHLDF